MRLKYAFFQLETSKTNFLKIFSFEHFFIGKRSHSAYKGAFSSPNAFFQAENIYGSEGGTP